MSRFLLALAAVAQGYDMFELKTESVEVVGLPVGPLGMNQYMIACPTTQDAVLIDCGEPPERFTRIAEERGWTIKAIYLTHGHFDHVMGVSATVAALDVPVHLHPGDRALFKGAPRHAARYGISMSATDVPTVDLEDGETLRVGALSLEVLHTPGHCPGLVVFHVPSATLAFVGDLIFQGSVGRVDLPGADPHAMQESLKRASKLPASTILFSGHGPATTMERELRTNPFLRGLR